MHSSRMRTARSLPYGGVPVQEGVSVQGGLCPGGLCPGGSLSRGVSVRETPSRAVDRQTPLKILPCPKPRLRAVTKSYWLFGFITESVIK